MSEEHSYWYLASYPKSGNTWCRVFITELLRLAGDDPGEELNLNQDIETGAIASSRLWLDDQLGVNSCDLSFSELEPLRGRAGASAWLFAEGERQADGALHLSTANGRMLAKCSIPSRC